MRTETSGSEAQAPLTIEDFAGRTGQRFEVETGGAVLALVLAEVGPLPSSPRLGGSFRLEFAAPPGSALPQATYALSVNNIRREIFLVPLGPNRDGEPRHEAVFF